MGGADFQIVSRIAVEALLYDSRGTAWLIVAALSALIAAGFFALEPWREIVRFELDRRQGVWRQTETLCGRTRPIREGPLASIAMVEAETPDDGLPLHLTITVTGAAGKTERHILRCAMQPADYPHYQQWIQRTLGNTALAPGPRILRKQWKAERNQ